MTTLMILMIAKRKRLEGIEGVAGDVVIDE